YLRTGSGFLYACSGGTAGARRPTLWRIPVDSGTGLGTPLEGPSLQFGTSGSNELCSPVSEFKSGGVDRIFVSVEDDGTRTGCSGPCVYSFNLSTAAPFDTASTSSAFNSAADRFMSVSTSTDLNTTESTVETTLTAAQAGTYYAMTIVQGSNSPAGTNFT